jgi:Na+-transporting methylmalonyl-CoA/oxaloacetate decarboxylase gamma subunit
MMENTLITGLYVSVISMAVTFIALGILIGVMYALLAIFPDKSKQVAGESDKSVAMIEEPEVDEKANQE